MTIINIIGGSEIKKILPFIIIILILSSFSNITYAYSYNNLINSNYREVDNHRIISYQNGSLSGYVNDSSSNPIKDALVSINCGGLHMHNSTDSNGFYCIADVPIVDCYWNVSASKNGYYTSWVDMAIDINSTYDFVLTSSNNIIYVGGDGPNNYSRIQDAIDNAIDGDTIFVYDGTYFENIKIDKRIDLIGENKVTTIIDADNNGDVIIVSSDGIYISGFTILNSGKSEYPYYEFQGIYIKSNENKIIGNIIYHVEQGINLNSSYGNIIKENVIEDCISHGIYQHHSNDNNISNNYIFDCNYSGITLSVSNNNIISHNTISNIIYGHGIVLLISNNNTITKNSLNENKFGIELRHSNSKNNSIMRNNFLDNNRNAKFYALSLNSNNIWNNNYWNRARILPKLIFGSFFFEENRIWLNGVNIDWNPAIKPNDISLL